MLDILKFDSLGNELRNTLLRKFNINPLPGDLPRDVQISEAKRALFRAIQKELKMANSTNPDSLDLG